MATRKVDLTVVNNGAFYPRLLELRQEAKNAFYDAKKKESIDLEHTAIDYYNNAHTKYHRAVDHIQNNLDAVNWARRRKGLFRFFR